MYVWVCKQSFRIPLIYDFNRFGLIESLPYLGHCNKPTSVPIKALLKGVQYQYTCITVGRCGEGETDGCFLVLFGGVFFCIPLGHYK